MSAPTAERAIASGNRVPSYVAPSTTARSVDARAESPPLGNHRAPCVYVMLGV